MMYSEFLERTGYSETYMTYDDYSTYIEPVYMDSVKHKDAFCKDFYRDYAKAVYKPVEMLISAKSGEALESFVFDGNVGVMDDVRSIERTLKYAFLRTLKARDQGRLK